MVGCMTRQQNYGLLYRYWPRAGSYLSLLFTREDYFPTQWIGLGNEFDHVISITN